MSGVLNRPNVIARGVMLLAGAIAALVIVLVVGGGRTYDLKLQMANASGLRSGSEVLLGGVQVGTVNALNMSDDNRGTTVIADLHLNPSQVKIGQGVRANIIAANLLGEKYVALSPGNINRPLPSGTVLPESATTLPSDLDQIVDVLDGATRARLAILLDEAGIALNGRQSDVSAILRQFPLSLTAATRLLTTMVQDNRTLADLVGNSDQFITRIDAQAADLRHVIDTSADATKTLALQAGNLRRTVAQGPKFARIFTTTFQQFTITEAKLTPIARELDSTLPQVDGLLRAVRPFTLSAIPTLNKAAAVAPTLTKLAVQATPTIQEAVPTLSSLQNIARLASPLSAWLGLSAGDLINVLGDWTGAIQYRDGLSHIFNGDVLLSPMIVLGAANRGASAAQRRQNLLDILSPSILQTLGLTGARQAALQALHAPTKAAPVHAVPRSKIRLPKVKLPLGGAAGAPSGSPKPNPAPGSGLGPAVGGLLGGLLGSGHSGAGASGATGASGTTAAAGSLLGSLKGLVGYLLGK